MKTPKPPAAEHVEETHRAISRLDHEHHNRATAMQRAAEYLTRLIGRPAFLVTLAAGIAMWTAGNLAAHVLFKRALDPPPYNALESAASVFALLATVLILSTQRREDELADRRERLTLHLAILTEQKIAKAIELMEEMRRDAPALRDRHDDQAAAMAQAAGPQTVLDAIEAYRASPLGGLDQNAR
jgi:uncharacterized membrane protein